MVTCNRPYDKVGCFHEGKTNMTLIINDRVKEGGYKVDWTKFGEAIHSLACRCAAKSKTDGYEYFSIRFWAECWAGKSYSEVNPSKWMEPSGCRSTNFQTCTSSDKECVGKAHFEYIYSLAYWSEWQEWGECSVPCGHGTQTRTRTCNNINNVNCNGDSSQTKACYDKECPTCVWKNNKIGIGSSEVMVPNISNKEDCLDNCLRKKSALIDGVSFLTTTPVKCYCISGVQYEGNDATSVYCKLKYGFLG